MMKTEKKRLRVTEAAAKVGCHVDTLRAYEERGVITPARNNQNQRLYSPHEILKVKELFESGGGRFA